MSTPRRADTGAANAAEDISPPTAQATPDAPGAYVKLHVEAGVGRLSFDRPERLNALNSEVLDQFEAALAACETDDRLGVLVLSGNERAFIAGADIEPMATAGAREALKISEHTMRVQERLAEFPKPTIAAIAGYALGAGLEIALCCDFRIAADNAVLGLPEIGLGLIPGGGGTQRLPRLVGLAAATELVFLGEKISATRAHQLGLLRSVVPLERLEGEVQALADRLLSRPSLALRAAKTALTKGSNMALKDALRLEQSLFAMLFSTADQKEGVAAFLEKRKPHFQREE